MTEGLRGRGPACCSGCWAGILALCGSEGIVRDKEEDWADGRVSESFFMFLRDLGLGLEA